MKAPVETLLEKIATFPPNYTEGIEITQKGATTVARVNSWSLLDGDTYTVSLRRHEEDVGAKDAVLLEGTCSCPAKAPCKHMAQIYAVVKGIPPDKAKEMLGGVVKEQPLDEWRDGVHRAVDTLIDTVIEQARRKT